METIELKQKHWVVGLPMFIQRKLVRTYYTQGLVQFDDDELSYCGDSLKWLEKFKITCVTENAGEKLAFEYLKKKYPEYGNFIQLW